MIKVWIPEACPSEIRYTLDVVLGEFLGLQFSVHVYEERAILINTSNQSLKIDATFFHQIKDNWLHKKLLDNVSVSYLNCRALNINPDLVNIPIIFGTPDVSELDGEIHLHFDVFGFIFFMLSRYEEAISDCKDSHFRFPDDESIMSKHGLSKRPTVNEYVEVFWYYIKKCDATLQRKPRVFRKRVSCDVDHPYDLRSLSIVGIIKRSITNVYKHRNMKFLITDCCHFLMNRFTGSKRFDRYYNNLDYIMDVNEDNNNVVCFNFIPMRTHTKFDDDNRIDEKKITSIVERIISRGHQIGFHPGYDTSTSLNLFHESADLFWKVFTERRRNQSDVGGRQHYLKFDILKSPQMWQKAGFHYDSSLGFSQNIGFRSGVCYEYSMYNLVRREKLALKQRPLIAMECSVLKKYDARWRYSKDVIADFENIKRIVKIYSGEFTLLWHNSYFNKKHDFNLFERLIK